MHQRDDRGKGGDAMKMRAFLLLLTCGVLCATADTRYVSSVRRVSMAPVATPPPTYKSCIASVWNMDDNAASTAVDDSGPENRDGTAVANTSTKSVPGVLGTALDFNGVNDRISIGDYYRFAPGTNFSISLWVYPKTATKGGNPIAKDQNVSPRGWIFQLHPTNYAPSGGAFYNAGAAEAADYGLPHPPTQVWTHIVITYRQDSTKAIRLYSNAVLRASKTPTGTMPNSSATLGIGACYYPAFEGYWTGRIDQVVIWTNKILTPLEITNIYNNGNGVTLP